MCGSNLPRDTQPLHIPASALIFNKSGLRVATVGADDKVLFKTVTIARDLGREIEIASGSRRRTASSSRRRTASPMAIRCASPRRASRRRREKPAREAASEKQGTQGRR